jgi:hypothetical protein
MARDRQVQRIDFAVDDHNAELAIEPVGVARVELINQTKFVARDIVGRRNQFLQVFDALEMAAGVEAGRSHQERK